MTKKPTATQQRRMEWSPDDIVVEKRSDKAGEETAATMRADDRPEEAP